MTYSWLALAAALSSSTCLAGTAPSFVGFESPLNKIYSSFSGICHAMVPQTTGDYTYTYSGAWTILFLLSPIQSSLFGCIRNYVYFGTPGTEVVTTGASPVWECNGVPSSYTTDGCEVSPMTPKNMGPGTSGQCKNQTGSPTSSSAGTPQASGGGLFSGMATGNPINTSTGNKFQAETFYGGTASPSLRFGAIYNSGPVSFVSGGLFSHRTWLSTFDRALDYNDEFRTDPIVVAYRPEGKYYVFTLNSSTGAWVTDPDTADTLVRIKDQSGNLIEQRYTTAAGDTEVGEQRLYPDGEHRECGGRIVFHPRGPSGNAALDRRCHGHHRLALGEQRSLRLQSAGGRSGRRWQDVTVQPSLPGPVLRSGKRAALQLLPGLRSGDGKLPPDGTSGPRWGYQPLSVRAEQSAHLR